MDRPEDLVEHAKRLMADESLHRVNLGANRRAMPGWENVDLVRFPGIDTVADLEKPWPWGDNTVDVFRAYDLVEHLHDPVHTMNEAWRCLKPYGLFEILVPSTDGRGAFQDPTHVSFWNTNSFGYYAVALGDDGALHSHNYRQIYAPHLIKAAFEVLLGESDPSDDGVIYVMARCIKAPDPGDCAPPES